MAMGRKSTANTVTRSCIPSLTDVSCTYRPSSKGELKNSESDEASCSLSPRPKRRMARDARSSGWSLQGIEGRSHLVEVLQLRPANDRPNSATVAPFQETETVSGRTQPTMRKVFW